MVGRRRGRGGKVGGYCQIFPGFDEVVEGTRQDCNWESTCGEDISDTINCYASQIREGQLRSTQLIMLKR